MQQKLPELDVHVLDVHVVVYSATKRIDGHNRYFGGGVLSDKR